MGNVEAKKMKDDKEAPCHKYACTWQKCFRNKNYDKSQCVFEEQAYNDCMKAYNEAQKNLNANNKR
jgi:hypothetical protein